MQLNDDQQRLLIEHLTSISPNGIKCPICGNDTWTASPTVFQLREFENGNLTLRAGSPIVPLVALTCDKCSFVHLLNASTIKLLEAKTE